MILLVHAARCILLLVSAHELAASLTRPAAITCSIHGRALSNSLFLWVQVSARSYRSIIHATLRRGVFPAWHSLLLLFHHLLLILETEVLICECDEALSLQHECEEQLFFEGLLKAREKIRWMIEPLADQVFHHWWQVQILLVL